MMTTFEHSNVTSLQEPNRDPVLIPPEQACVIPTAELVRRVRLHLDHLSDVRQEHTQALCDAALKSLPNNTDCDEAMSILSGMKLLDLQRCNEDYDFRLLVTALIERTEVFHG